MNLLQSTAAVEQHALQPGSRAWLEHRFNCNNASDAPAMLGCDDLRSRNDLLHALYVGFTPDVSNFKQGIYDDGHRYEGLARPLAERVIGEDLYPLVLTRSWREHHILRPLGGSMDGSTLARKKNWEHKQLNKALAEALPYEGATGVHLNDAAALPKKYRVQMEQQMMVNDAEQCLFTASAWNDKDELVEERHCWYYPDPALRAEIVAGWVQFEADLAAYTPVEVIDKPVIVARQPDQLPALRSEVRGQLVLESNIKEWEEAALAYIKDVRNHELKTDEDFANADAAAKWCDTSKTALQGVRSQLMSATGDVNMAVGTLDRIMKELDSTRVAFTNKIKERKEDRKKELVEEGRRRMREYIASLDTDLATMLPDGAKPLMPEQTHEKIAADFSKCVFNKKSLKAMQDAIDQEVARGKIAAGALRDQFRANYLLVKEEAKDHGTLFPDWRSLLYTPSDLLRPLVRQRIADHVAEQERLRAEAEAKRLREEAAAKAREEEAERQRQQAAAPATTPAAAPQVVSMPAAQAQERDPFAAAGMVSTAAAARGTAIGGSGASRSAAWNSTVPVNVGPDDGARGAVPANEVHTGPIDLKLGEIVAITGVGLTEDFLTDLGFPCAKRDRQSRLYYRGALPAICDALIRHLAVVRNNLHQKQAEAA